MSSSSLYRVYRTTATEIKEFRDGHGSAPIVWGHLSVTYLKKDYHSWVFGEMNNLWSLATDKRVPRNVRLCHTFTFDWAVCPPGRTNELAEACQEMFQIGRTEKPDYVNHWADFAEALRLHKPRPRELGIGLGCTSVCDPWEDYAYTRNKEGHKPWNIFKHVDKNG